MVLIDTGFFYALADWNDRNHLKARNMLSDINEEFATTWPVIAETCHLLLNRLGNDAQKKFMSSLPHQNIIEIKDEHLPRMRQLMEIYAELPMDLADASIFVVAESLGCDKILSTDRRLF